MLSSNDAPPDDGQLTKTSVVVLPVADAATEVASTNTKNSWLERSELILVFLFIVFLVVPFLTIRFFILHREITFRQARQIRAALIRDRTWKWWHIGYVPWLTINWMLMTYDEKKDALSARIKSGKRALDAFSHVRDAMVRDGDMHDLFELWQEFQERDEAAFRARDKKLFMARMGSIITQPARVLIENAILLRTGDYLVLKNLCSKSCRYMDAHIIRVGLAELALVDYFIKHKAECCQRIQGFKATILRMARQYVDNMIAFCIAQNLSSTAHLWAQAGRCIIHLQDLTPTDDNEPALHREVEKFISYFEQAGGQVYVKYQELERAERERQLAIENAAPGVDIATEEGVAAIGRWPFLHREKVGRFKFKWDNRSLTITDTAHRESDHSCIKFEGITAPQALDILEELISTYSKGYGELIMPLGKEHWQASMDGAAGEFVRRESETWKEAYPDSKKEVQKYHNRHRRIIPDGHPLRES